MVGHNSPCLACQAYHCLHQLSPLHQDFLLLSPPAFTLPPPVMDVAVAFANGSHHPLPPSSCFQQFDCYVSPVWLLSPLLPQHSACCCLHCWHCLVTPPWGIVVQIDSPWPLPSAPKSSVIASNSPPPLALCCRSQLLLYFTVALTIFSSSISSNP